MIPQTAASQKIVLLVLIGLGFAGLIGAHELSANAPNQDEGAILPLVIAAFGTLCFVAAGLMARRLMKRGTLW